MTDNRTELQGHVDAIRAQLRVNLSYFTIAEQQTLELLQSHIETRLQLIERDMK